MQGLSGSSPIVDAVSPAVQAWYFTSFPRDSPSMSNENVLQEITQLRHDLKNMQELDEPTRTELSKLEKRIEDLLDDSNDDETAPEKVIFHIEESATNFAVQHPKAESTLRRIAYALGRMI